MLIWNRDCNQPPGKSKQSADGQTIESLPGAMSCIRANGDNLGCLSKNLVEKIAQYRPDELNLDIELQLLNNLGFSNYFFNDILQVVTQTFSNH